MKVKKIFDNKLFQFAMGLVRFILGAIILFYVVFVVLQRFSGNKSVMGYRLFTVATGSMSGVYEVNDVIAVQDCDINTLKVGDDIAYQGNRGGLEGMLITHRIIKIEVGEDGKKIFTTKGVNAPAADPVISEKQVLGKVVGIVPLISLLNHVVKSQLGFFLLIFCPLVLIIVLEVLQTITDIQLEKNEIREIKKEKSEFEQSTVLVEKNKEEEVSSDEEEIEEVVEKKVFDEEII